MNPLCAVWDSTIANGNQNRCQNSVGLGITNIPCEQ
ncbi:Uncharacterised protein [Serratia fonticola]|nr:Uncharacterised protein [Serratia fonticola]